MILADNGDIYGLDGTPVYTDADYAKDMSWFPSLTSTFYNTSGEFEINFTYLMFTFIVSTALFYVIRNLYQKVKGGLPEKAGNWKNDLKRKFKRATNDENPAEDQKEKFLDNENGPTVGQN